MLKYFIIDIAKLLKTKTNESLKPFAPIKEHLIIEHFDKDNNNDNNNNKRRHSSVIFGKTFTNGIEKRLTMNNNNNNAFYQLYRKNFNLQEDNNNNNNNKFDLGETALLHKRKGRHRHARPSEAKRIANLREGELISYQLS